MPTKELKKLLDYCLNVKECSNCEYANEKECMLTCTALMKECLNENYAEVVRCKDCKHFSNDVPTRPFCRYYGENVSLMHFCSYGGRKDS